MSQGKNSTILLLNKFIRFFGVSGIGWLIDFSIFCVLVYAFHVPVFWANISGAVPAVTFAFFISVRKVFVKKKSIVPLWLKYAIYICYIIILLLLVSTIGQWGCEIVERDEMFAIFRSYAAILIKCGIAGITVLCNFFMVRFMVESI